MFRIYREIFEFFNTNIKQIGLIVIITELPLIIINNLSPRVMTSDISFFSIFLGIMTMGLTNGALTILFSKILNRQKINISQIIKESLSYLPKMIIGIMIYGAFVLAGVLCFIIPGIIIGARLSLYNYYIVYENMEPFQAIKQSAVTTNGFTLQITSLFMAMFGIVTIPYLFAVNYLSLLGVSNLIVHILVDVIFSLVGTLVLVMTFRIYCMVKQKNGVYF